ncbi:hypothetical protein AYO21_00854 [Fonsecaea monophora]|uniref:DUF6594 domain-containing protein n=1 Tax=Fonsecaea monophora TaxID=254056 RepID=A0A177FNJ0_9EURO|nr:hypothetical protein AYO21_00854 [Fonsecaea monophora]KAH0844386.1 hypothetical protein FOPE_09775 [Fonsecaea pedrosoi]OAG44892.1 hypothetical protein AYO21_00854 [Fonsecaea monophora]
MNGYDAMCSDMATNPEAVIFRKFTILNYRALLFLQSELNQKEGRLVSLIKHDQNSLDPERRQFSYSFDAMLRSNGETEGSTLQRELMREICHLLPNYSMWFLLIPCFKSNYFSLYVFCSGPADFFFRELLSCGSKDELLLQIRQLGHLPPVHEPSLKRLREAQMSAQGANRFLRGREQRIWSEKKQYDLTSLTDRQEDRDPLSSWLEWCVTDVWHKYFGHKLSPPKPVDEDWAPAVPSKLGQYPRSLIARIVTGVTTILAPIFVTLSAVVLFFVDSESKRLGLIVGLSFLFSLALACVGVPRRIDSFVATATFTAVLIVFIENNTD